MSLFEIEKKLTGFVEIRHGWLHDKQSMKSLFNQLEKENFEKVVFDFENIMVINRTFVDEYLNQKWKASFDVIEINMCEPTKNFFIKRKEYWTELGNSLKPNYNINIEKIKEDFLRRLETENDGMYGE